LFLFVELQSLADQAQGQVHELAFIDCFACEAGHAEDLGVEGAQSLGRNHAQIIESGSVLVQFAQLLHDARDEGGTIRPSMLVAERPNDAQKKRCHILRVISVESRAFATSLFLAQSQ